MHGLEINSSLSNYKIPQHLDLDLIPKTEMPTSTCYLLSRNLLKINNSNASSSLRDIGTLHALVIRCFALVIRSFYQPGTPHGENKFL